MTRKARPKKPQHQLINEHMPPLHYGKHLEIKSADPSLLRTQFTEEMANAKDRAKRFWSVAQANGEQFGTADPRRWEAFVHGPLNLANNLHVVLESLEADLAQLDDKTRRKIERALRLAWECGRHDLELSLYDSRLVELAVAGDTHEATRDHVRELLRKKADHPDVIEVCQRFDKHVNEAAASGTHYTKEAFYMSYTDVPASEGGFKEEGLSRSTLEQYLKTGGKTKPKKRRGLAPT